MKEKWKLRLPNLIALIMIICAVGSLYKKDPYSREWYLSNFRSVNMELGVPNNAKISEDDARRVIASVHEDRKIFRSQNGYDAYTAEELSRRLDWAVDHVRVVKKADYPQEFSCDGECVPLIIHEINEVHWLLEADKHDFCASDEGRDICLTWSFQRSASRSKLVERPPIELVGIIRHKLTSLGVFLFLALSWWLYGRGQRVGYSFGSLFGNKLPRYLLTW